MPPGKPAPSVFTLNDHATALVRSLPEPLPSVVQEICASQGFQPWHFVVGHLLKADQRAELHAPILLPEWTASSETPAGFSDRRCLSCEQRMTDKTRAGAVYCCNFCGSGRWQRERIHHRECEFFILPKTHLAKQLVPATIPEIPPEDPQARLRYEEEAFERHLQEATAAELSPGGLPPLPEIDPSRRDNAAEWTGAAR